MSRRVLDSDQGKDVIKYQEEVDKNYEVFQKLDDDFYHNNSGMYALMKDRKVVEIFSSWQDARKTAKLLYKDEPFSIQKIEKRGIDLGFYPHAVL